MKNICEETDCRFFSECPYENNLCMCAFDEEIEQKDEQEALSKWEKLTQKEDEVA